MTADKYLTHWCSNDAWWDYDEDGVPYVLPSAPKEAHESYAYYLSHREKNPSNNQNDNKNNADG